MICREYEDGYLFIPQTHHAWGCGELAAAWGNEQFAAPDPHAEVIQGTMLHDMGWIELDTAPSLNDDGTPHTFMQSTVEESRGIWQRAVHIARLYNPYAALMVSMHASYLYSGRVKREKEQRNYVEESLAEQHRFQKDLIDQMRLTGRYAEGIEKRQENYRVLRICDLLSLVCCTGPLEPGEVANFPESDESPKTICYAPKNETTLEIAPYPFVRAGVTLTVEARYIPRKTFDSVEQYHQMLYDAELRTLTFTFVPAAGTHES